MKNSLPQIKNIIESRIGIDFNSEYKKISSTINDNVIYLLACVQKPRHINIFYKKARKNLFWNSNLNKKEITKQMQSINAVYEYVKELFKEVYRENDERYFIHLRETAYIILNEFPNPTIEKLKVAFLHDVIEDTKVTFNTIKESFWNKTALSVQAITKCNILDFLKQEHIDKMKKNWILDEKGNLQKKYKKIQLEYLPINDIKEEDNYLLRLYLEAKEKRNNEYFSRFESFNSLKNYIRNFAIESWINNLEEDELNEITQNAFDVKYADRIHNIRTQWNPNDFNKIERKIFETNNFFLKKDKNINPTAHEILWKEYVLLENNLINCPNYQSWECKKCIWKDCINSQKEKTLKSFILL